jgi:glutathione S-transferase
MEKKPMTGITIFGFPASSFVHIVRLVLTHKEVPYTFHDLEPDMGSPKHLALHPFDRVPILQHADFMLYETSAIVAYLEAVFPHPALQPTQPRDRALMNQWIGAVNSYYYPYMIYHVGHERKVFPKLGIEPDEKVVAHALPKIEIGLQVIERQLADGGLYLVGADPTIADYYLLPSTFSFARTDEGKAMQPGYPVFSAWRERVEALPTVRRFRAAESPYGPIEHARKWAVSHPPKY